MRRKTPSTCKNDGLVGAKKTKDRLFSEGSTRKACSHLLWNYGNYSLIEKENQSMSDTAQRQQREHVRKAVKDVKFSL